MSENLEEEFIGKSVETRLGLGGTHRAKRSSRRHSDNIMYVCR
jgi:hypothetical protein